MSKNNDDIKDLQPVEEAAYTFRETNSDTDSGTDTDGESSDDEGDKKSSLLTASAETTAELVKRGPDRRNNSRAPTRYRPIAPRPGGVDDQISAIARDLQQSINVWPSDQVVEPQPSPGFVTSVNSPPSMYPSINDGASQIIGSFIDTPLDTLELELLGEIGDLTLPDEPSPDLQPHINVYSEVQEAPEPQNQVIAIDVSEKMVCEHEISLLPSVRFIFNSRREHGETFMHQLARAKKIQQTLMAATVQKLMQSYGVSGSAQVTLSTNVFMQSLIERAHRDSLTDCSLLYDLVNVRNDFNETPLLIAVKTDRADLVELLVTAGANPNILSLPQCHTCLHKAAFRGAYKSFSVLMAQFYTSSAANLLSINQIDLNGNTALAIAVISHHRVYNLDTGAKLRIENFQLIGALINAGANTKIVNNEKNSLAHLVCLSTNMSTDEKRKILKLFSLSKDEFSNHKNIYKQTAYELLKNSINSPEVFFLKSFF